MERLGDMERTAKEILDTLKKRQIGPESNNVNTIKIEGAGSIWNGLALGVVFGATLIAAAWMVSTMQDMRESVRQAESYRAAVYVVAPQFAEAIEAKLKKEDQERKNSP